MFLYNKLNVVINILAINLQDIQSHISVAGLISSSPVASLITSRLFEHRSPRGSRWDIATCCHRCVWPRCTALCLSPEIGVGVLYQSFRCIEEGVEVALVPEFTLTLAGCHLCANRKTSWF